MKPISANFFIRGKNGCFAQRAMSHVPQIHDICVFNEIRYVIDGIEWCMDHDASNLGNQRVNIELIPQNAHSPKKHRIPCQWQPIETLPENKDLFLAIQSMGDKSLYVPFFMSIRNGVFYWESQGYPASTSPTHWMPIPEYYDMEGE